MLTDNSSHIVLPREKYLTCYYLEKVKETKKFIHYKLLPYFTNGNQVMVAVP